MRGRFSGKLAKAWASSGRLFCSLSWAAAAAAEEEGGRWVGAGLAEGLLSRLLVPVPPVAEVTTEAVSSRRSTAATALEEEEEEEEDEDEVEEEEEED